MSGGAIRKVTRGYSQTPNSVVENLAAFTHAELALALILLRRGGPNAPVKLSDQTWHNWTGLSPRAKEYAAAGLKKKGLEIEGRGENAKYVFKRDGWETFVRGWQGPQHKPRTLGRVKGVTARPGAVVHPACADKGCAMLAAENGLPAGACGTNAQPVARMAAAAGAGSPPKVSPSKPALVPFPSTPNAQPVARLPKDPIEHVWPKAAEILQYYFAFAGAVFLARLVATVAAVHSGLTDDELAKGIRLAYDGDQKLGIKGKKKTQDSEGLFLLTVPNAVAVLRKVKAIPPAPDMRDGAGRLLDATVEALRNAGPEFSEHAVEVWKLRTKVSDMVNTEGLEAVESAMEKIEGEIVATGTRKLGSHPELKEAADAAVAEVRRRSQFVNLSLSDIPAELLANAKAAAVSRRVLLLLDIPQLSLFYA